MLCVKCYINKVDLILLELKTPVCKCAGPLSDFIFLFIVFLNIVVMHSSALCKAPASVF